MWTLKRFMLLADKTKNSTTGKLVGLGGKTRGRTVKDCNCIKGFDLKRS